MLRPYLNAVGTVLSKGEIVFDKFHVLQHASAALDEVRRQEFFRAGAVMREHGRGKRWLLLRRWKTVRGSKRGNSRICLPRIGACSKRTCCGSNSIGCGPTRLDPAS
jgi:transposase